MVFTTVAFHEATSAGVLEPVAPIGDEHVTTSLDDLTIPTLNQIVAALIFGGAPVQAQIRAPSLRAIFLEDLGNMLGVEKCLNAHESIIDRRENPLPLVISEKLNVYENFTADAWALLWLADGPIAPVRGEIHTIKADVDASSAGDVWENENMTLYQTLPAGRYQVVGMKAFGTGLLAARLIFVGGIWRPGVPAGEVVGEPEIPMFRKGNFGVFGEFEFDQPPTVDLLGTAAVTDADLYLDLIQIRKGRAV